MSDILRGVPLSQSTQMTYQAPPSMASQAAQLGLGAYGLSRSGFFKEGGEVKGYAEGGIASAAPQGSVPNTMSIDKLRSALGDMSEEQLDAVAANAGDATTLALVQEQKTLNARIRNANILAENIPQTTIKEEMLGGLEAAPVPESMFADTAVGEREEQPEEMASGGIVAFAKGKEVKAPAEPKQDFVSQFAALTPEQAVATEAERAASAEAGLKRFREYMGEDETKPLMEEILKTYKEAYGPEAREQQKGLLALKAASKFGRRGKTFQEELGEAMGSTVEDINEFKKLEREAKRQMTAAQLDFARAKRAEKRGDWDMAEKYGDKAAASKEKAFALKAEQTKTLADIQLKQEQMAQQERLGMAQVAATRAGQTDVNRQALANFIDGSVANFVQSKGRNPNAQELAQIRRAATEEYAKSFKVDPYAQLRAGTSQAELARKRIEDINKELNAAEYGAVQRSPEEIAALKTEKANLLKQVSSGAGVGGGDGGGGVTKPTLQQFLEKARAANPGISDADLTAYYNKTYGK